MFRWLWVLILLFSSGLALADHDHPLYISDLAVQEAEIEALMVDPLTIGVHVRAEIVDGCGTGVTVEQSFSGRTFYIHLYTIVDPRIQCFARPRPYEATIPLDGYLSAGSYQVQINDRWLDFTLIEGVYTAYDYPHSEDKIFTDIESAWALLAFGYSFSQDEYYPESTQLLPFDNMTLLISGTQNGGCDFPIQTDLLPDRDFLEVLIYRPYDPMMGCPFVQTSYRGIIPLDHFYNNITINHMVHLNIYSTPPIEPTFPPPPPPYPPLPPGEGSRILHVIDEVQPLIMESYPPQIAVRVIGYQPDGCDFPVHVDQIRDGNTIYVEIYRIVPQDVMCTMIVKRYDETIHLSGAFSAGQNYTIFVNGVKVEVRL